MCVPFSGIKKVAVAVSGGADSFALLHLAQDWAKENGIALLALTLDHGFRPESADEAQQVARYCADYGIPHHILHWQGDKPVTALQEKARAMRRRLLCEACGVHGVTHLLLGHQADDQAETFFMRVMRGSGLTGLAAMKPVTQDATSGVMLCRPLLGVRRAALRAYCLENGVPFVDDPSNENRAFERVRVRRFLEAMPELADGVVSSTERLARAEAALQDMVSTWLTCHAHQMSAQSLWIPCDAWRDLHSEIRLRVLALIVDQIMDKETAYAVQLSLLENWETQLLLPDFKGANLAGCWASAKKRDTIDGLVFRPEPMRRS